MHRFHVHVSVDDIAQSTAFYTHLFGEPARVESDYVKWMLEDPRINFAISKRGAKTGINHLGIQVDSAEELVDMRAQLNAADASLTTEVNTNCCYAKSDKFWVTDPQGIAWETYHTLDSIPTWGGEATEAVAASCGALAAATPKACCT